MSEFKSDFLNTISERGFIHQISDSDGLDTLLSKESVTCYIGFDPTGPSLHAGHMMGIMLLYWFQQTGHRPIALMGGGTALVGDPSGKDEARQMLTEETIQSNIDRIRKSFEAFLDFEKDSNAAVLENNAGWLKEINYIEFLRDFGKNFSVNAMLARDSVKNRLDREQHLSLLEFNYMCLQAYDFVELNKRYDARLQMGGSDQWGNIVSGVDLGRRHGTEQLFALTCPLLTTSSGAKMGKTADGAVWLNGDMLSPFDYWQYWRNTEDADVTRFLKLFTPLPMDEIAKLSALQGAELNEAKKILATEATAMVHGRELAEQAQETARKTFEEGATTADLPTQVIAQDKLQDGGIGILSAIVEAGLAKSNGEARRHIKGGAIKLNDTPINDEKFIISADDLQSDDGLKLSFGKKRHILIKC